MAENTNVLLKLYEMHFGSLRQMEDHRVQITNMVLLIASVVVGFIAQRGLTPDALPLTILLIALGLYGAIVSEKYYERWGYWRARLEIIEKKFDKMYPDAEIIKLLQEANVVNKKEFPRLNKLRLHHLWLVLHLGIATAGIILTLFIVLTHRT